MTHPSRTASQQAHLSQPCLYTRHGFCHGTWSQQTETRPPSWHTCCTAHMTYELHFKARCCVRAAPARCWPHMLRVGDTPCSGTGSTFTTCTSPLSHLQLSDKGAPVLPAVALSMCGKHACTAERTGTLCTAWKAPRSRGWHGGMTLCYHRPEGWVLAYGVSAVTRPHLTKTRTGMAAPPLAACCL
jgi:hypothetical protein